MADPAFDATRDNFVSNLSSQQAKADQATDAAEKQSQETATNIRALGKQRQAVLDDFLKNRPAVPDLPAPSPPPQASPDQPLQDFGGLATLIGIFGGAMTRRPLVASLNAAAGAMNSYHQKNLEDFNTNLESWKANQDYVAKLMNWRLSAYQAALKGNEADVSARTQAIAAASHDESMLSQNAYANAEMRHKVLNDQIQVVQKMQDTNLKVQEFAEKKRDDLAKEGDASENFALKQSDPKRQAFGKYMQEHPNASSQDQAQFLQSMSPSVAAVTQQDVNALTDAEIAHQQGVLGRPLTDAEKAQIRITQRNEAKNISISDDAADLAADRVLAGDERATTGMARSQANITKVTNSIVKLAKERGMNGADIAAKVAEFGGAMASQRALGTRVANMEIAANEVKNMAPLALSMSTTVDRTQYPSLNKIIIAAERGTGNESVVRFGLAANSLIYTYAKFLNPNGIPTDTDKARAADILDTAWSKGQFSAAIDQIQKEIQSGQAAIASTKGEISGNLTGKGGVPTAAPSPGPGASQPKRATLNGRTIEVRNGKWVFSDTGQEVPQ